MRGEDERSGSLFSYVDLEARVRQDHPLRVIRAIVNDALANALWRFFCSCIRRSAGRRSRRSSCCERCSCRRSTRSARNGNWSSGSSTTCLFRWFVGLGVDDAVWDATTFTKNRDRLLEGDIAAKFLSAVLAQPRVKQLLEHEHFSVDGTLIEAWASLKSFRPKDGGDRLPMRAAVMASRISTASGVERHARLDHRSRGPALPQGAGQRSAALLHGPRADGEPQRPYCRRGDHPGRAMPSGWRRCT